MSDAHEMIQELNKTLDILVTSRLKVSGTERIDANEALIKSVIAYIELVTKTASMPVCIIPSKQP